MKIIFLDVDGVLNNYETTELTPDKYIGIDDKLVELLSKIVKLTDAKIVLMSDWKDDWNLQKPDGVYLDKKLEKYGLEIIARTYESYPSRRGEGVRAYLKENKVEEYVLIDDTEFSDFTDELEERFVNTDPVSGLTLEDVQKAIKILN